MLSEIRQLAGKIEGSEGVAETLAAADAKVWVYNPSIDYDPEMFERNLAMASFSQVPQIVGKRPGQLSFGLELKGSGVAATAPEWAKYLQGCGVGISALKSINIGAITGGPFRHGETITGGTSAGKGRVIINTANGATAILYVVISGSLQSGEVITGGTSGATATTSSSSTTVGNVFEPISAAVPSLTLSANVDGFKRMLKGARGKVKFNFKTGEPAVLEFNYSGVEAGIADAALFTGIASEPTIPPALINSTFLIDAYAARIQSLDVSLDNTISPSDDPSSDRGLKSFQITNRKTIGSFDPELVATTAHDFYSKWFNATSMVLDLIIGASAGNKFRFYAPLVQYTKVGEENRGGIAVAKCAFALNGTQTIGNDEWALLCQ